MNIKYILTRIKTKKMNIRMCLFLSRTPSLEYNIIHITLLSENKWNLLMIYFYFCRHVSIIIYINYIIFNGHGHYLIFSLCYCRRNVSPHCHMFTSIKGGGGGLPSPHRKMLGNHFQYFRSQCSDSIPYQCCRWLLPCCFLWNRAKLRSHCNDNGTIAANQHCVYSTHAVASRSPLFLTLDQVLLLGHLHLPTHPWIKVLHIHQSRVCYRLTAALIILSSHVTKQSHIWPCGSFLINK